jgi:hypothetical protein
MTVHDKYHGDDQVHTASGSGMKINHVGHSILRSPIRDLHLKNILHVPCASKKNLLSVNRLVQDNNTFLEFHPNHFLVKEQDTKRILFKGSCEGGLYPLKPPLNKEVLGVFKPTTSTWHHRLGHASQQVVHKILSRQKIPFIRTQNNNEIWMHVKRAKVTNCPTPNPPVFPPVF